MHIYFFQGNGELCPDVVSFSAQIGMLDLDQLEDDIAWSPLHSLVSHVGVSQVRVAGSARSYLQGEFLDSRNDFLGFTKVTLFSDNLSFSLAARTHLRVEIVVSSSQLDPSGDSPLSSTLSACYHVVRILSASSFAVRTGYLLLN